MYYHFLYYLWHYSSLLSGDFISTSNSFRCMVATHRDFFWFNTVLGQKKGRNRMLEKSTSSRPIILVFTHEPRYINKFLWKKKIGAHPQKKPPFPWFFEKIGNTKNTFFPSWQEFRTSIFEKRPKIVDFWGPRPRKFFSQNLCKKTSSQQKLGSGASASTFYGLLSKMRFWDFAFKWIWFWILWANYCRNEK